VLLDPSPRLQVQEVGFPLEVSVKETGCSVVIVPEGTWKLATGGSMTELVEAGAAVGSDVPLPHPARARQIIPGTIQRRIVIVGKTISSNVDPEPRTLLTPRVADRDIP